MSKDGGSAPLAGLRPDPGLVKLIPKLLVHGEARFSGLGDAHEGVYLFMISLIKFATS